MGTHGQHESIYLRDPVVRQELNGVALVVPKAIRDRVKLKPGAAGPQTIALLGAGNSAGAVQGLGDLPGPVGDGGIGHQAVEQPRRDIETGQQP